MNYFFMIALSALVHYSYCYNQSVFTKSSYYLMDGMSSIAKDAAYIHRALFDHDTLMVLGIAALLYGLGLACDGPIHSVFYRDATHTNAHQLSDHTIKTITSLTKAGIWGYSAVGMLVPSMRHKATLFLLGYASSLFVKTLIKGFEWWPGERPYNQRFKKRRIYTGFPSGQMTQVTYLATALGLEYGPVVGVGLGMLVGIIAGVLVGSNRHYVSQVVAGSALGISYGIAVHKTMHLADNNVWSCGVDAHNNGYVAYHF